MLIHCVYKSCQNQRSYCFDSSERISFFNFPKDEELCKIWLKFCKANFVKRKIPLETLWKTSYKMCEKHFWEEDFKSSSGSRKFLKKGAEPILLTKCAPKLNKPDIAPYFESTISDLASPQQLIHQASKPCPIFDILNLESDEFAGVSNSNKICSIEDKSISFHGKELKVTQSNRKPPQKQILRTVKGSKTRKIQAITKSEDVIADPETTLENYIIKTEKVICSNIFATKVETLNEDLLDKQFATHSPSFSELKNKPNTPTTLVKETVQQRSDNNYPFPNNNIPEDIVKKAHSLLERISALVLSKGHAFSKRVCDELQKIPDEYSRQIAESKILEILEKAQNGDFRAR